jgi:hypothetical protein
MMPFCLRTTPASEFGDTRIHKSRGPPRSQQEIAKILMDNSEQEKMVHDCAYAQGLIARVQMNKLLPTTASFRLGVADAYIHGMQGHNKPPRRNSMNNSHLPILEQGLVDGVFSIMKDQVEPSGHGYEGEPPWETSAIGQGPVFCRAAKTKPAPKRMILLQKMIPKSLIPGALDIAERARLEPPDYKKIDKNKKGRHRLVVGSAAAGQVLVASREDTGHGILGMLDETPDAKQNDKNEKGRADLGVQAQLAMSLKRDRAEEAAERRDLNKSRSPVGRHLSQNRRHAKKRKRDE